MRSYINYCGKSNSGKSTVLSLVIEKLKKSASIISALKSRGGDCRIVFEINHQVIAISTYGDDLNQLLKNHLLFDKFKPQVMVTASHAHDNQAHNCFIDNYVHNNITFDNKPSKTEDNSTITKFRVNPVPRKAVKMPKICSRLTLSTILY